MAENYETIKSRLLESGSLFDDEDFPAEQSSIFYKQEDGMPNSWTNVEWKRPSVSLCEVDSALCNCIHIACILEELSLLIVYVKGEISETLGNRCI